MKKLVFLIIINIGLTGSLYCSNYEVLGLISDSTHNPTLKSAGVKVYRDGVFLRKSEVMSLFKNYPNIYRQYNKGYSLRHAGTTLIISGLLSTAGGIALMISGIETTKDYYGRTSVDFNSRYYTGAVVEGLGLTMILGGITCRMLGKNKIKGSIYKYNNVSLGELNPPIMCYEFGILTSGIGVKLSF
jgi:hypothetical protein